MHLSFNGVCASDQSLTGTIMQYYYQLSLYYHWFIYTFYYKTMHGCLYEPLIAEKTWNVILCTKIVVWVDVCFIQALIDLYIFWVISDDVITALIELHWVINFLIKIRLVISAPLHYDALRYALIQDLTMPCSGHLSSPTESSVRLFQNINGFVPRCSRVWVMMRWPRMGRCYIFYWSVS